MLFAPDDAGADRVRTARVELNELTLARKVEDVSHFVPFRIFNRHQHERILDVVVAHKIQERLRHAPLKVHGSA